MNPHLTLYRYLWVAPHVLLVAVAIVMFRKRLHREFPVFFAYLFFELLQFCVLYAMYLHLLRVSGWVYGQFDLYGRVGSIALHFGILHELFESPVKHDASLRRTTARALNWVTGLLVVLASVFIGIQYYNSLGHRLLPPYATVEALNIAQCFLLVLVFLWHRYLGLRMSTIVFGIALGMGLTSSLEPLIQAWKDSVAVTSSRVPDYLQMVTYHCTVLVWLCAVIAHKTFNQRSGAPPKFGSSPQSGGRRLLEVRESLDEMEKVVHL